MLLTYRFERIEELADVEVMVENRGDELVYEISGAGSNKFNRLVKHHFEWFNRCGPITRHEGSNVYTTYFPPMPSRAHARMLEGFIYHALFQKPMPRVATIEVTGDCQCSCIHCSAHRPSDTRPVFTRSSLQRVVSQCLAMGIHGISYTGGEPLLRPDLEDLISLVPRDQATVNVFTNAVALTEERARSLKAAGTYGIMISLDSPSPEEHDRLRNRPGAFEAVERGAQAAIEAGLLVSLSTYTTQRSVREGTLGKIVELGAQWGVHEISVFNAIATGRYLRDDKVMIDHDDRKSLLDQAATLNKRYGGRPRIITKAWTNQGKGISRYMGCMSGHYHFHITAQGDFTPCDLTPLSFGNVNADSVQDIWERLSTHSAYCERRYDCRMMSREFRKKYLDPIPEDASLPYPVDELDRAWECRDNSQGTSEIECPRAVEG